MCTVTYLVFGKQICITSNRDEQVNRKAIPPAVYQHKNKHLTYPKDPLAGGTWFAADEFGNIAVLLNGAKEKHSHKPPYGKSRGLIVIEILQEVDCLATWRKIDLDKIEPFTIVLFFDGNLFQLQWDGHAKDLQSIDSSAPHIWSSSTLYDTEIRINRESWFRKFLMLENELNPEKMLHFHQYTESDNPEYGLVINRNGRLKTLSITQAVTTDKVTVLTYNDLINASIHTVSTTDN
jgi:uncharacterized protein with NRDE domain